MFWEIMGPDGGGEPSGELADAINDTFGGFDDFKQAVNDAGVKRFGSGWTWLVHDGTSLAVYSTANQDHILTTTTPSSGTTSGSTPTTSSTRTGARSTSRRGGTSSTGTPSPHASTARPRNWARPAT